MKIFLNFTYLGKTQPGQKAAGNFPNFLKISSRQVFGYLRLHAGLDISWFPRVMAFPKVIKRLSLNNRNSGIETIVIIVVIVVRTIPKRQISAFPVVLAIVLPQQLLLFKIQGPAIFM